VRVSLVYVLPVVQPDKYRPAAKKFIDSYMEHPPGAKEHDLVVCLNGGGDDQDVRSLFSPVPVKTFQHNNWGKDLGAFLVASHSLACDLMICCGSHVNFRRSGWLDRIVEGMSYHGPCVAGTWAFQVPNPHIRTTFFWCPPEILYAYPDMDEESKRYQFEHGPNNLCVWSQKMGLPPYQVTWEGFYPMSHWHPIPPEEALARDQHSLRDFGQ
jgi:hypothetical protein